MEQRVNCSDCQTEYEADVSTPEEKKCPACGSIKKTITLKIEDTIEMHDQLRGKVKKQGKKKPTKEFITGDDYNHSREKFVHKEREIDRENDRYREVVKDKETGEIIHQDEGPLSEHWGHGTAKRATQN